MQIYQTFYTEPLIEKESPFSHNTRLFMRLNDWRLSRLINTGSKIFTVCNDEILVPGAKCYFVISCFFSTCQKYKKSAGYLCCKKRSCYNTHISFAYDGNNLYKQSSPVVCYFGNSILGVDAWSDVEPILPRLKENIIRELSSVV